uniref:Uncharacterized protein n=1 Tax=Lepeophtheirus salmonis TaxID=72036 RepID=A0A0K2T0I8_LEPSM
MQILGNKIKKLPLSILVNHYLFDVGTYVDSGNLKLAVAFNDDFKALLFNYKDLLCNQTRAETETKQCCFYPMPLSIKMSEKTKKTSSIRCPPHQCHSQ